MAFLLCISFMQAEREIGLLFYICFSQKSTDSQTNQYIFLQQDAGYSIQVPGVLLCRNKAVYVVSCKCRGPPALHFISQSVPHPTDEMEEILCLTPGAIML